MSEHLEPLVAAYVAQRQRDFHQSTRGIPTPENRAVWEFDASEKIRAHDREVEAAALREAVTDMRRGWLGHWNLSDPHDPEVSYSVDRWLEVRADRIESQETP